MTDTNPHTETRNKSFASLCRHSLINEQPAITNEAETLLKRRLLARNANDSGCAMHMNPKVSDKNICRTPAMRSIGGSHGILQHLVEAWKKVIQCVLPPAYGNDVDQTTHMKAAVDS